MRKGVVPAVLAGGLVAATCDFWVACTLNHLPLLTIGKAVARGWFGGAAMQGGTEVALIGIASHYAIVLVAAALFVATALREPALRRWWPVTGPVYGVVVFCFMRFVVLPLSAAGYAMPKPPGLYWEVAGHLFLVGLPIAAAARYLIKPAP